MTRLVLGTNKTGLSVIKHLKAREIPFIIADSRVQAPNKDLLQQQYPDISQHYGPFDVALLDDCHEIIVSPGIALNTAFFQKARQKNIAIISDITLFTKICHKPIIGITGTNGKSTVTLLVGDLLKAAGYTVWVGGNLGEPVLNAPLHADYYVLELSSFQLDITPELPLEVACILNITPDHAERYSSFKDYVAAKQQIYKKAKWCVFNKHDVNTVPNIETNRRSFCEDKELLSPATPYSIDYQQVKVWQPYLPFCNVCAALAILADFNLSTAVIETTLKNFKGLAHRMQVINDDTHTWINDSKATNIAATIQALKPFKEQHNLTLILGGKDEGEDFTQLRPYLQHLKQLLLIGETTDRAFSLLRNICYTRKCYTLEKAVQEALSTIEKGDTVLLSPACKSFGDFDNFEQRGDKFIALLKEQACAI